MRIHQTTLRAGITRTLEFERKGLATHAVNIGTKCGHDCLYCSTGAILRMHHSFKDAGEDPFGHGYAIVDPTTPERVARDAERIRDRGMVQVCTLVDAWAPEAKEHDLGRRCLEAILAQPGWTVRVLTKNAAIVDDFDFIKQHRNRILVGLSITATPDNQKVSQVIEQNASPMSERIAALGKACDMGLRTYAMFCPFLPGIADSPAQVDQLIRLTVSCRAEEIFVEPVNGRGPGLKDCQAALQREFRSAEAMAIEEIRQGKSWSPYVADLIAKTQRSVRRHSDIAKLRFLLYPSRLQPEDRARIEQDDAGVIWLEQTKTGRMTHHNVNK